MKRVIAVLLAIMMLAGISASAEETRQDAEDTRQAAEDFIQSLEQWVWNLNPEASDYMGTVRWIGGKPLEVFFRNDGSIIELEHSDFGKVQFSGDKVMLDVGGKKFGLSFSAFAGLFRRSDASTSGKASVANGLELLRPWLMKAFSDIVLPCVSLRPSRDGLMIHLEANNEVIREKVSALVDSFIEERKTAETLLSHYGSYLRLLFPELPRTFDELEKAWQAAKRNPAFFGQAFSIVADVTYSQSDDDLAVTGKIDLFIDTLSVTNLSFELVKGRDAADLIFSLNNNNMSAPIRLEYHRKEGKLQAAVEINGYTYSLTANQSAEGDGKIHYSVTLGGRDARNRALTQYDLEAVADPDDGSVEATLYNTKKPDNPDSSRKKLGTLDVVRRVSGWDGTLDLPIGKFLIHLGSGDQYGTLRLEYKGFSILPDWYVEAWLYHPAEQEYRLVVDTNLVHRRQQIYTLEIRKHELDYTVSVQSRTACHIKATYNPLPDGCEVNIEYMNPVSKHPVFRTGETPSTLSFAMSRNHYQVNLEWFMSGKPVLKGEGTLDLGANGLFREMILDVLQYGRRGNGPEKHYRLAVNPFGITVVNNEDVFSLGLTENTAEKLAVALTNGKSKEYGGLILSLEDGIFSGKLKVFGMEMAGFSIQPIPKEPIEPIGEEGALMITPDTLLSLLGVHK